MKGNRIALVILLLGQVLVGTGCTTSTTSALWKKERFARYHHPAEDVNLKFFFSDKRQDILVEYNELTKGKKTVQQRAYWLEKNASRMDHGRKPRFVSPDVARGLSPVPIVEKPPPTGLAEGSDRCVVVSTNGEFTPYSGDRELGTRNLPAYYGSPMQKTAQVVLTPATVTVDAATVLVVTSPYWAPAVLQALAHCH